MVPFDEQEEVEDVDIKLPIHKKPRITAKVIPKEGKEEKKDEDWTQTTSNQITDMIRLVLA